MKTSRLIPLAIAAWLAIPALSAEAQTSTSRPVALSGTDGVFGPGLGAGVLFSEFSTASESGATPALNRVGQAVFAGRLVGTGIDATNDTGIWVERGGLLVLLARTGEQAPGTAPGVTFSAFERQPIIGASGKVAFFAVVAGPGVDFDNNDGLWSEGSGSLELLLRERTTPVPGSTTSQFGNAGQVGFPKPNMWWGLPAINSDGRVLASVFLTDAAGLSGYYTDRSGVLEEVVREGDLVPGFEPRTFGALAAHPAFSDTGAVAFWSVTTTPFPQYKGIWSDRTGPLASIAINGDPAPGTASNFSATGLVPSLNKTNLAAFQATVNGTSTGVWSEGQFGVIQPIALEGSVAPGTSDTFFAFDDPVLGDGGATAFVGTLNLFAANRGVWSNRAGLLGLIARSGAAVPGVLGATFKDFHALAINAGGEVAFFTTTSTGKALCRESATGVLSTVFSEFTILDVLGDGSDLRLITDVVMPQPIFAGEPKAGGTGDGRRLAFSDGGEVVARLKFSDGSEGVFTTAPLPAFKDIGSGLAGTFGVPILTGSGTLAGGTLATLDLTGALGSSTAGLVFGLTALNVPFLGGVLVPSPDAVVLFATGAAGDVQVSTTWPTGTPPGLVTYYQFWVVDPVATGGVSASNALSGTTP